MTNAQSGRANRKVEKNQIGNFPFMFLWVCKDCCIIFRLAEENLDQDTHSCLKEWTKPLRFFPRDHVWQGMAGWGGVLQEFLGSKKVFFLTRMPQRGIRMTFSLPWQGIGTFWFSLARNLYFLARRDWPR